MKSVKLIVGLVCLALSTSFVVVADIAPVPGFEASNEELRKWADALVGDHLEKIGAPTSGSRLLASLISSLLLERDNLNQYNETIGRIRKIASQGLDASQSWTNDFITDLQQKAPVITEE